MMDSPASEELRQVIRGTLDANLDLDKQINDMLRLNSLHQSRNDQIRAELDEEDRLLRQEKVALSLELQREASSS